MVSVCSSFKMCIRNVTSQQKQLRNSCSENRCLRNERPNQKTTRNTNKYSVNFIRFKWGWITNEVSFFRQDIPFVFYLYICKEKRKDAISQSKHNFISVQTSYMFRLYIAIRLNIELSIRKIIIQCKKNVGTRSPLTLMYSCINLYKST
jgi:hypothetical protein